MLNKISCFGDRIDKAQENRPLVSGGEVCMKNQIYTINKDNLDHVRQSLKEYGGIWIAEIDGEKCDTLEKYLKEISDTFHFPISAKSLDGYADWMTDLDWLHAEGYALIIKNFNDFMKDDESNRNKVLWLFRKDILPFWQSGVQEYVVEGKVKPFNVYLVS